MKNLISISKQLSFLLVISFLFLVSCKKEGDFQEEMNAEAESQVEIPPLAVEKLIVENVFRITAEDLTDEQILAHYEEYMQTLSEEDRTNLVAGVEQALSEGYNASTMRSFKNNSSETILSAGNPDDGFGYGVATVGNKVYVGARTDQKVYEYAKTGGNYNMINEILPGEDSDDFGNGVSVSGSWMAVSAPAYFPVSGPGKVFMYKKQGNAWVQQAVLTSSVPGTAFGRALVLRGNKLAVLGDGSDGSESTISVFELKGNNWTLSATIQRPGYIYFEMDMDNGGNRIVVNGGVDGRLFVGVNIFIREGSNWVLEDEVIISTPGVALARDVAIYSNTIVLTAFIPGNKHFVFTRNGSDWDVQQELMLPDGDGLGNRWAGIFGDKIIIGTDVSFGPFPKRVHLFEKSGGAWTFSETFAPSDNAPGTRMWGVAINDNTIVAGYPGSFGAPGKAYIFD
jgi:hypothetical protein